jgi:hypothetical protein
MVVLKLGFLAPTTKGKCLHGYNQDKLFLDSGIRVLPQVLEDNIGEAALPTKPTQGKMARHPMARHPLALVQHGGIVA